MKTDNSEHLRSKNYELEYQAFSLFVNDKPLPLKFLIILLAKSVFSLAEMSLRYIPGGVGFKLRYYFYKPLVKKMGRNVLIDTGVFLNGLKNITLGDFVWIDANCRIEAMLGEVSIGKRVHVAPFSIIAAREPVILEDYVGISSFVKIYANSEAPVDGKRMSGPMIPENYKAYVSKPIILKKDSFVGCNSILLPGAGLEEGAVLGANSVLAKKLDPWVIAVGSPAKVVSSRQPVTVPEL
jgi:acetyltransferase-like isoleucine patch superfamily enzyme